MSFTSLPHPKVPELAKFKTNIRMSVDWSGANIGCFSDMQTITTLLTIGMPTVR